MTDPSVHHRLLIRHPTRAALLLAVDGGALALPAFDTEDRHTAEVDHINAAVRARFALATTVLQSLSHDLSPHGGGVTRVHMLAVHGDAPTPAGARWCELDALGSLPDGDTRVAREWIGTLPPPRDGRDWCRPGWFESACAWITAALRDTGVARVDAIVQLRNWMSSCVLRADTPAGEFYFKAVPASARRECAVTAWLAQHCPDAVPRLTAHDVERRWLLLRGCRGPKLEDVADPAAWERAATQYGRLQVECAARSADLRALGCPQRSPAALAAQIEPLLAYVDALGDAGGLSFAERQRLHELVPEMRRRCAALAAASIPLTIEHGDLWPGNFLRDDDWVVIDWEDVAVGHPFFSLAPLLVGLRTYQPALDDTETRRGIEMAYLSAFGGFATAGQLRNLLTLAAPLSFVDMAIRYRSQPPSAVRLHPWMRDLVPQTLQLALGELQEQA